MAELVQDTMVAGRYRVEARLGEGGMAEVYQCLDTEENKRVAIKRMHPHLVIDKPALIDRFRLEARLMVRLSQSHGHRNVVGVQQVLSKDDLQAIVMDLVEDGLGLDTLRKRQFMPVDEAVRIICEVLRGLEFIHAHEMIHRDIKPSNILMAPQRDGVLVPKIADFGIALDLGSARDLVAVATLDDEEDALGSPPYMAPELFDSGSAASVQSDLYAVGVCLYELVVGQVPFIVESLPAHIMNVSTQPAPRLRDARADLPEWLDEIVAIALAKDAAERFPSAQSFFDALASHGTETDVALRTSDPTMIAGDYHVNKRIGRGPIANVFDCRDVNLNVPVAIKLLRGADSGRRERFAAEARAQSALHQGRPHRNIAAIRLIIAHEDTFALVMERVSGVSFDEYVNDSEPDANTIVRLIIELCDGLHQAHEKGVIHHDLHPRNVLVTHVTDTEPAHIKITDFGMDNVVGRGRLDLARSRGCLSYLAPELLDPDAEPTVASDLYSIGVLMMQAIIGATPPSVIDKPARDGEEENAAQRALPALPPALDGVLRDLLSSDPAQRPESARVLADQLEEAQALLTADLSAVRARPPKLALILAAVVVLATVAVAVALFMQRDEGGGDSSPSPRPPPDTRHADYLPLLAKVASDNGPEVKETCLGPLLAHPEKRVVVQEKFNAKTLRVLLRISLSKDAQVQDIVVLYDDLEDFGFGDCLSELAQTWIYPPPPFAGEWEWTPIDAQ